MATFYVWSIFIILYQTCLYVIFSWLTLQCLLVPNSADAHELTLIKMLYFYEPETCGRVNFYNYTIQTPRNSIDQMMLLSSNAIAKAFRKKLKISMSLHIAWLGLALLNISQGRRACGFYVILLPLTFTGLALLVVDVINASLFLRDSTRTQTEAQIWQYVVHRSPATGLIENVIGLRLNQSGIEASGGMPEDTSWVAMLFAYISIRGVVQWIVNFWIIKDTYFDGLRYYRELRRRVPERRKSYFYQM